MNIKKYIYLPVIVFFIDNSIIDIKYISQKYFKRRNNMCHVPTSADVFEHEVTASHGRRGVSGNVTTVASSVHLVGRTGHVHVFRAAPEAVVRIPVPYLVMIICLVHVFFNTALFISRSSVH